MIVSGEEEEDDIPIHVSTSIDSFVSSSFESSVSHSNSSMSVSLISSHVPIPSHSEGIVHLFTSFSFSRIFQSLDKDNGTTEQKAMMQLKQANESFQEQLLQYFSGFVCKYQPKMGNVLRSFETSLQTAQESSANLRQINANLVNLIAIMQQTKIISPLRK